METGNRMSNVGSSKVWLIAVPIRLQVISVLKSCMNNYFMGTPDDPILSMVQRWAQEDPTCLSFLAAHKQNLVDSVNARPNPAETVSQGLATKSSHTLPSILPKRFLNAGMRLNVLLLNPTKVSQQITIKQMHLYMNFSIIDCFNKVWKMDQTSSDNLTRLSHHQNKVKCFYTRSNYS